LFIIYYYSLSGDLASMALASVSEEILKVSTGKDQLNVCRPTGGPIVHER